MKYNRKLWNKFISNRLYGFDLIHIVDGVEQKVLRFIRESNCTEYKNDNGEAVSIPDVASTLNFQINRTLSKIDWKDAFIKSREICQNHPGKFKISHSVIIKELR